MSFLWYDVDSAEANHADTASAKTNRKAKGEVMMVSIYKQKVRRPVPDRAEIELWIADGCPAQNGKTSR